MPVYEYKCDTCGKISEFLENSSKRAKRSCVHCGGTKLTRQFSIFSAGITGGESKRCHGCSDSTCPHAPR